MGYGDDYWGRYRDYYRDTFPIPYYTRENPSPKPQTKRLPLLHLRRASSSASRMAHQSLRASSSAKSSVFGFSV